MKEFVVKADKAIVTPYIMPLLHSHPLNKIKAVKSPQYSADEKEEEEEGKWTKNKRISPVSEQQLYPLHANGRRETPEYAVL